MVILICKTCARIEPALIGERVSVKSVKSVVTPRPKKINKIFGDQIGMSKEHLTAKFLIVDPVTNSIIANMAPLLRFC